MGELPKIWITWETQRRNTELAAAFGCKYAKFDYSKQRSRLLRYVFSGWKTFWELTANRHSIVFVQCPSVVLTGLVTFLKAFIDFRLVIDMHNISIVHLERGPFVLRWLLRKSVRSADIVIVSNRRLENDVVKAGGRAAVLPDKLPHLELPSPRDVVILRDSEIRPVVTLIASFDSDEPIDIFLQAASLIKSPFTLYVTGRKSRARELLRYSSEKIRFTDFLPDRDYDFLIQRSDLLVDLTTLDNCLVCGAYEAISAGVPCLLSDSEALRETFPRGFIFSKNTIEDLKAAYEKSLNNISELTEDIVEEKRNFEAEWARFFDVAWYKIFG